MNGALQAFAHLATIAAAIGAYDHWRATPTQRIAVVNLAEVYRQKETEFSSMLTRSTSAEEREQAMQLASRFAKRLPEALEDLPRECACLVLLSSAVVAPSTGTPDLTVRLKAVMDAP